MAKKTSKLPLVCVYAHNGKIVVCPSSIKETKEFIPSGGMRFGSILLDSKKNLGVSEEALALMEKVPVNGDCCGDLDWFKCDDKKYAFGWFGALNRVVNPNDSEAARNFRAYRTECTIIPNDVPEEVIEGMKKKNNYNMWRTPFSTTIDNPEKKSGTTKKKSNKKKSK
jgi:hypothetical protein